MNGLNPSDMVNLLEIGLKIYNDDSQKNEARSNIHGMLNMLYTSSRLDDASKAQLKNVQVYVHNMVLAEKESLPDKVEEARQAALIECTSLREVIAEHED